MDWGPIFKKALAAAHETHNSLGKGGEKRVQVNQFGENSLLVDVESEEAVLDVLREADVSIRMFTEEHGELDVTDNEEISYVGTLDGLDGSNRYLAGRGRERYGTMLGVFHGDNPCFGDYLASGIMEHATKRLFLAERGRGAWVFKDNLKEQIRTSGRTDFDHGMNIYIDEHYELNRLVFKSRLVGFRPTDPRSMAVYFADLASGAVDLVLICARKLNLELASAYGLVVEAGGAVVDIDGRNLSGLRYRTFGTPAIRRSGEPHNEIPVIAAATPQLAKKAAAFFRGGGRR